MPAARRRFSAPPAAGACARPVSQSNIPSLNRGSIMTSPSAGAAGLRPDLPPDPHFGRKPVRRSGVRPDRGRRRGWRERAERGACSEPSRRACSSRQALSRPAPARGAVHHELRVALDPESHGIKVEDTITLPAGFLEGRAGRSRVRAARRARSGAEVPRSEARADRRAGGETASWRNRGIGGGRRDVGVLPRHRCPRVPAPSPCPTAGGSAILSRRRARTTRAASARRRAPSPPRGSSCPEARPGIRDSGTMSSSRFSSRRGSRAGGTPSARARGPSTRSRGRRPARPARRKRTSGAGARRR